MASVRVLRFPALVHAIRATACFPALLMVGFVVGLVAVQRRLLSMHELWQLRDVRRRGVSGGERMHHAARIRPHMQLHPEVPLIALARLLHLGIARFRGVLCRAWRGDNRGVDDGGRPRAPNIAPGDRTSIPNSAEFPWSAQLNIGHKRSGEVPELVFQTSRWSGDASRFHVVPRCDYDNGNENANVNKHEGEQATMHVRVRVHASASDETCWISQR